MANNGVGKFKGKPTIAVEQAVNGAGAKPNAASSMKGMSAGGKGGRHAPDSGNTGRNRKMAAPDHRVPTPHKQAAKAVYVEASR